MGRRGGRPRQVLLYRNFGTASGYDYINNIIILLSLSASLFVVTVIVLVVAVFDIFVVLFAKFAAIVDQVTVNNIKSRNRSKLVRVDVIVVLIISHAV